MKMWDLVIAGTGGGLILIIILIAVLIAKRKPKKTASADKNKYEQADDDVNHLFDAEFREELRNRGRLRFETIINENAMFLKQDLDMTIAQLNQYMKKEIGSKLNDEFAAYTKAMQDAQQLAISSLERSANAVEEQRQAMTEAVKKDVAEREAVMVKVFEENMAKIIEQYLMEALGQQFDLKTQLPYIISQMETNKQAIIQDMQL